MYNQIMNYLETIKQQFNDRVEMKEKRPGIVQLYAPLYHEDGDMVDIFLQESPGVPAKVRVCDHGMTLMRLSYEYDVDTPNKERIFQKILSENGLGEINGNLYIDASPEELYPAILQFAQTISKVSNMRMYRREVIHSLFFETLEEIVESQLQRFHPRHSYFPLPQQEEYEVDYCFNNRERPIFMFGVNSPATARLAIISCLKFQTENLKFYGAVVLDGLDSLGRKDQSRLLSAADKVFPSLDDLRENGEKFLEREIA